MKRLTVAALLVCLCAMTRGSLSVDGPATQETPALGSPLYQPSPEHPIGWRSDGTGRYTAADPPVHWARESVAVSKLRCQASRPAPGDAGQPMKQGAVSEWLVAVPMEVPKDYKLDKDTIAPDAGAVRPAEGEALAGTVVAWKKFVIDSTVLDWSTLLGRNHKPDSPPAVVLANTYIYSPTAGPFVIHAMNNASGQVFVNGKLAADRVNLVEGWNSILIKVQSGKTQFANTEGLDSRFSFFGAPEDEFTVRNVAWVRRMPAIPAWQSSSASTPVIAGDRIFVTCEYRTLCCLSKQDGRILWARTITFYDAMTDGEKQAHPDIVKEIEPLAAKLREIDESYATGAAVPDKKLETEQQISKLMEKVGANKYSGWGVTKGTGEVGVSIQTPVTDGKHVWVSYVAALLACYDMDGNRVWVRSRDLKLHGERVIYPPSPILLDGKFIVDNPWGTVALDAATGEELWRLTGKDYTGEKGSEIANKDRQAYYRGGLSAFTSSLLAKTLAGEPLVVSAAFVARARDGKFLACNAEKFYDFIGNGYATPIFDGPVMCKMCKQQDGGGLIDLQVWGFPETAAEPFRMKKEKSIRIDTQRFPIWCFGEQNASPLYDDGLVYCVSSDGVLSVVDVEKGEVVYQQQLDADLLMHHNYGAGRGGMCSSTTLAGKHIYLFGNQGTCLVIEPGRTFKLVARNRIENTVNGHPDIMVSSPVFEGRRLYFRTDGYVYCIEEKP